MSRSCVMINSSNTYRYNEDSRIFGARLPWGYAIVQSASPFLHRISLYSNEGHSIFDVATQKCYVKPNASVDDNGGRNLAVTVAYRYGIAAGHNMVCCNDYAIRRNHNARPTRNAYNTFRGNISPRIQYRCQLGITCFTVGQVAKNHRVSVGMS